MTSYLTALSLLLMLFSATPFVFTQESDDETPDMEDCGPRLLPLASCAPFVQGAIPSPMQSCCDHLVDLYDQQPKCLCSLLNDTTFANFPINRTLALELPVLCELGNISSQCPGFTSTAHSPQTQVSKGINANSSVAASPMVASAPISHLGFGVNRNASAKLKVDGDVVLAVFAAFFLLEFFRSFL